ncbi:uncharacterized protein NEMAJ01_0210 [Nematocida major]|uniref:uncharacterized protein n=1 Tax=Nematocida major TaxID=1912982 RepID=UPI0020071FE8|nr:uncharacterized protein NEMAJ01_0210 [Nematocida major]KAH9385314.1 hypothetical protein NEMAJ01_0210 [Nematocida major]
MLIAITSQFHVSDRVKFNQVLAVPSPILWEFQKFTAEINSNFSGIVQIVYCYNASKQEPLVINQLHNYIKRRKQKCMNLRIPIGFITMIFAVLMSAFVVFDLVRHMEENNAITTDVLLNRGGYAERENCMLFLNEGQNPIYDINKHAEHENALCFVEDILDPLSKVDLKIYSEKFGANETSEIEIKYKLLDGESMRNNFARYQKNCVFDNLEPIDENSAEMSRFACFTPEPAYTSIYANIIGDRNFVERKSELLKDESLKKFLYFGRLSCLWSENYYLTLSNLVYHSFYPDYNRPDSINTRRIQLLGGVAFVYDAVKFNTFSTIELIISRYQQTLRAFKNDVIQKDDLQKLAAAQLRTDAYSLIDSLAFIGYIAERINIMSKEHVDYVKEGSISAAAAGTREVHALDFSIMNSLNSSTFGKDNIFTKQKFTWENYENMDANMIGALKNEINTAWESPIPSMKEDLEALRDLLKTLKSRLGTDQTFILVKGISLDKVDADSVENIMKDIHNRISWLKYNYGLASKKFEKKISDFCKNKTSDCLPDVHKHEYKSMPDDPMKGTITLENHRSAYEEDSSVDNDPSASGASDFGRTSTSTVIAVSLAFLYSKLKVSQP